MILSRSIYSYVRNINCFIHISTWDFFHWKDGVSKRLLYENNLFFLDQLMQHNEFSEIHSNESQK